MKKLRKKRLSALLCLVLTLVFLMGCGAKTETEVSTEGLMDLVVEYTEEDLDSSWDPENAVTIALSGDQGKISGDGAVIDGKDILISQEGTYVVSGTWEGGQIRIEADEKDKVHLVLNGVQLSNSDGPAIYSVTNDKVILTLAEGSINSIKDGSAYTLAEGEDEPDAAVFSKSDLTINGSGNLTVTANYKNGIASKDDLVITGGTLMVTALNDAVKGKDSIAIKDGIFTITALEGDGLQASNSDDAEKGWISIDGGTFTIQAKDDGLQAESLLQANSGSLAVTSSGDALHSNTNMKIAGAKVTIAAGDDALHADASLLVEKGTLKITDSYEGLEAGTITVAGGTIDLTAKDDGFNAAGGNDSSSLAEEAPSKDSFAEQGDYFIKISGGNINVNANGDGIDSNGSIYISGGTLQVNGPTGNGNGALDYDKICEVTGGTLLIAGSSGMAQMPSKDSSQVSVGIYYTTLQKAGTSASLTDETGKTILSFTPEKDYQFVLFSSGDLKTGATYNLLSGDTELTELTVSETITKISQDGTAVTGNTGGMGGKQQDKPAGTEGEPPQGITGGTGERPELPAGVTEGERPEPPEGGTGGDRPEPPAGGMAPPSKTSEAAVE